MVSFTASAVRSPIATPWALRTYVWMAASKSKPPH